MNRRQKKKHLKKLSCHTYFKYRWKKILISASKHVVFPDELNIVHILDCRKMNLKHPHSIQLLQKCQPINIDQNGMCYMPKPVNIDINRDLYGAEIAKKTREYLDDFDYRLTKDVLNSSENENTTTVKQLLNAWNKYTNNGIK